MSRDENPFEVSESSYGDRSPVHREASVAQVTSRTIELLNQTRPWVRLIGILAWIGTFFLVIATLFLLFGGVAANAGGVGVLIGLVYGFMALIYGMLASKLMGYGRNIYRLNQSEDVRDLEAALDAQRGFWKLAGIIVAVILIAYLVIIVMMIAGVGMMAFQLRP